MLSTISPMQHRPIIHLEILKNTIDAPRARQLPFGTQNLTCLPVSFLRSHSEGREHYHQRDERHSPHICERLYNRKREKGRVFRPSMFRMVSALGCYRN